MRQKVTRIMETLLMMTEGGRIGVDPGWEPVRGDGQLVRGRPALTPRAPGGPRRAGRSAGNYAHQVARALGLDLRDVTYSGATTDDVLRTSARGSSPSLRPSPRLHAWSPLPLAATTSATYPGSRSPACRGRCGPCRRSGPRSPGLVIPPPPTTCSRVSAAISRRSRLVCETAPRPPGCSSFDYLTILPPAGEGCRAAAASRDRGLGPRHRGQARDHDTRRGAGRRR